MYLFFDTETTGIPAKGQYNNPRHPQTPKLVEIAGVLMDNNQVELDYFTTIIEPYGFEIPKAASDVHGITTERAKAEGMKLDFAYDKFVSLCNRAEFLVAHNAQYDTLILDRVEMDLAPFLLWRKDRKLVCTKELTTDICRIPSPWGRGFKWPTLAEVYKHFFNETFDNAHSALADVRACARVFFAVQALKAPPTQP